MERYACGLRELKIAGADGAMTFSGYGAIFGIVDWYGDSIKPGAFTNTLAEAKASGQWPSMLLQHGFTSDMDMPIGIWTDMHEDSLGLFVEGKLAPTERGQEAYALLKMEPRPAINGLSIGYRVVHSTPRINPEDPKRTLTEIWLGEVSLVTFPANLGARVHSVKSEFTERAAEQALRDAGASRTEAKTILAKGFKALSLRDADDEGEDQTQQQIAAELVELYRRNTATLIA